LYGKYIPCIFCAIWKRDAEPEPQTGFSGTVFRSPDNSLFGGHLTNKLLLFKGYYITEREKVNIFLDFALVFVDNFTSAEIVGKNVRAVKSVFHHLLRACETESQTVSDSVRSYNYSAVRLLDLKEVGS